jgi:hypothetical protein
MQWHVDRKFLEWRLKAENRKLSIKLAFFWTKPPLLAQKTGHPRENIAQAHKRRAPGLPGNYILYADAYYL